MLIAESALSSGSWILLMHNDRRSQGLLASMIHEHAERIVHSAYGATHNFKAKMVESKRLVSHDLLYQDRSSCSGSLVEGERISVDKGIVYEGEMMQALVEIQGDKIESKYGNQIYSLYQESDSTNHVGKENSASMEENKMEETECPRTPEHSPEIRLQDRGCTLVSLKTNQNPAFVNTKRVGFNHFDNIWLVDKGEIELQGSIHEQGMTSSLSFHFMLKLSDSNFPGTIILRNKNDKCKQQTVIGDTIADVQTRNNEHLTRKCVEIMTYIMVNPLNFRSLLVHDIYSLMKVGSIQIQSGREMQDRQLREITLSIQKCSLSQRTLNVQSKQKSALRKHVSTDSFLDSLADSDQIQNVVADCIQDLWHAYHQKKSLEIALGKRIKAAVVLQLYWRKFCTRRHQKVEDNLKRQVVLLQAFIRRYLVQKQFLLLRKSALLIQKIWRAYKKHQQQIIEADLRPSFCVSFDGCFLTTYSMEATDAPLTKEDAVRTHLSTKFHECSSSSAGSNQLAYQKQFEKHWQSLTSFDKDDNSTCYPLFQKSDSDGNTCSDFVVNEEREQMNIQEDWNDIEIDHVDECLDTCLAFLRPLSSSLSSVDVKNLDLLDNVCLNFPGPNFSSQGSCSMPVSPQCKAESEHGDRYRSILDEDGSSLADVKCHDHRLMDGAFGIQCIASTSKQQMVSTRVTFNHQQEKAKFEHFAEIFVLQHTITSQQFHAQYAPPFPHLRDGPPTTKGLMGQLSGSTQACIPRCETSNPDLFLGVNHYGEGKGLERPAEISSELALVNTLSQRYSCNLVSESASDIKNADVVLEIVGLLKYLGETCASSESAETIIDIWDNIPHEVSPHNLAGSIVGKKQLRIPDFNAVFMVFFTVLMYLRSICRGGLPWTWQPQWKP